MGKIKYDHDPENDYNDGYNSGRRYKVKRKGPDMKIINLLYGKKTYIVAVIIAVLNLAVAFGWVTPENLEQINAVLIALGFGALRAGVNKV